MTGEDKTGEEIPEEFQGVDTEGFSKDELEALLEGDGQEPEKEAAPEPEKEPEAEAEPPKMVPLRALHEARDKLKTRDAELGELRQIQNRIAEKLAEHRSQPEPEVQPLDVNEDPLGYISQIGKTVEEMRAQSQQTAEQQQKAAVQYNAEQQTINGFVGYRETLVKDDPETAAALDYAITKQGEAYRASGLLGYDLNNAMRQEIIRQANISASLPPEMRREHILGTARYFGYNKEPEPANPAKEQIDKLAAVQAATKTLSGGGASANPDITLDDVDNMSGAELDQLALSDPEFFARLGIEG
jgi:hypothetical protein